MLYELRIYHMHEGKMEDIHRRIHEVTLDLFAKHGIRVVNFWEDATGKETLYYVVEYEDMATREQRWNGFAADPLWQQAKLASEAHGPIVSKIDQFFMTEVPYFPRQN